VWNLSQNSDKELTLESLWGIRISRLVFVDWFELNYDIDVEL
jgi:hypothetical protein